MRKSTSSAKPEKKSRNPEKTRQEILRVTFTEVFKYGFQGVSVDDIVKKTSVTKGALFHQFPSKLELGYALVEEVIQPMIIERWITPLEDYENPLEGILDQMHALIGKSEPSALKLGCPLNNLVQEMTPLDEGFRKRLRTALNLWIDETEKHLWRAQENGYLKPGTDIREVAYFVVMSQEGFFGMIKALGAAHTFPALYESLKRYFQAISVRPLKAP